MKRLILALALTPALLTTGTFAQQVSEDVSKQLWCGEALVVAFSNPPPGVPDEMLAQAKIFIDGGNQLIDDATQKYLDAGSTEEQITKIKADLVIEVTAVVSGQSKDAPKYTFEDCQALLPAASTAPASSEASSAAPAMSSEAMSSEVPSSEASSMEASSSEASSASSSAQ